MSIPAILKLAGSAIWRFLSSLSLWQAIALGVFCWAILLHFQLVAEKRHSAKLSDQLHKATEALDKLSAESKARQKETEKVIVRHETVVKPEAERRAKIIENAPVSGKCETPRQVLDADI